MILAWEIARREQRRAIVLIDLLVYISLLAFVLILMAVAFDQGMQQCTHLRRNVADIERAMKAGERWRSDVRAATGEPWTEMKDGQEFFHIPVGTNEIAYSFQSNRVYRFDLGKEAWEVALLNVKGTEILAEKREHAAGWRWELELERRQRTAHVRPLFTFLAVPGGQR
jgi:hypothetical protein